MPTIYVTYEPAQKNVIIDVFKTQQEANASASLKAGVTALQNGNTVCDMGYGEVDAINVVPGDFYVHVGSTPELRNYPPATEDIDALKIAASEVYSWLRQQVSLTHEWEGSFPEEVLVAIRNQEFRAHQGIRAVLTNSTYTIAQRLKFCEETIKGSADVPNALALAVALTRGVVPLTPLEHPLIWVDPRDGRRQNVLESIALSGKEGIKDEQGRITKSGLDLQSPSNPLELFNDGNPRSAFWINTLRG